VSDPSHEHSDDAPVRRGGGVKADINVTPLVDVVLVLLIIFMVVTPQMESGVAVDLPKARNTEESAATTAPVTLSIDRDGAIYLEKEKLEPDSVEKRLAGLHEEDAGRPLVLKADRAVAYERVREIFQSCQSIGFPGVSLQVIEQGDA
jgi:biopolymer transport protein TolR